jgi:signal transduction histidine kinase
MVLALTNLIKNAIFFTPERGDISISSFSSENSVCIQVTDTGIGIEEDKVSYVFDRFYRVESSRSSQTGGSGLGLSIAKRVVELHSGVIQLESLANHGSVFRIILSLHHI